MSERTPMGEAVMASAAIFCALVGEGMAFQAAGEQSCEKWRLGALRRKFRVWLRGW